MSWNYRVLRRVNQGEPSYQIHEVYYNKKGVMDSWSAEPIAPSGQTKEELTSDLMMMRHALRSPVLIENGKVLEEYSEEA